jgi:hypothetical protein
MACAECLPGTYDQGFGTVETACFDVSCLSCARSHVQSIRSLLELVNISHTMRLLFITSGKHASECMVSCSVLLEASLQRVQAHAHVAKWASI